MTTTNEQGPQFCDPSIPAQMVASAMAGIAVVAPVVISRFLPKDDDD